MKKQTMWLVDNRLYIYQVDVIMDGKKPAYYIYLPQDEDDEDTDSETAHVWKDNLTVFSSKKDAEKYADERRQKIFLQMAEVKKFVENIDSIDMGDYKFEEKDYLGFKANDNFYEKKCKSLGRLNTMYENYILRGTINIDAWTFKLADVKAVKWCKNKDGYFARVILNDDTEARTHTIEEYEFVQDLFGDNKSDRVFNQ